MHRPRTLRLDNLLRTVVAGPQAAGYVLVIRERRGPARRPPFAATPAGCPGSPGGLQLTHDHHDPCLRLELQPSGRILAWYYQPEFPPDPAQIVPAAVAAMREAARLPYPPAGRCRSSGHSHGRYRGS
jgi:hypothetical protein